LSKKKAKKKVYIFIGPPGSGKGTLSHLCEQRLGWVQLSTGNLCRKHIAEQTEIGKQIDFALKSGKLVSDELINAMVHGWFEAIIKQENNVILDGFPRTVGQAQALHAFLKPHLRYVDVQVVRFSISDESVITRICNRLVCLNKDCQEVYSLNPGSRMPAKHMRCDVCSSGLGRRNDDAVSAIKDRLQTYHKHERDLLKFYEQISFSIREFMAEMQLNDVFEEFKKLMKSSGI
jgi:adenylate kinase